MSSPSFSERPARTPASRLRISQAALAAALRELRTSRTGPGRSSVGERHEVDDTGELEHALHGVRAAQERQAR